MECCSYLLFLFNLDYADRCYTPNFNATLQQIRSIFRGFAYYIFLYVPLDPIPESLTDQDPNNKEYDLPLEKYPPLTMQSKSWELELHDKKSTSLARTHDFPRTSVITSTIANSLIEMANRLVSIAKWLVSQNRSIRFILNFFIRVINCSVMFSRLYLAHIILNHICFCHFLKEDCLFGSFNCIDIFLYIILPILYNFL